MNRMMIFIKTKLNKSDVKTLVIGQLYHLKNDFKNRKKDKCLNGQPDPDYKKSSL